MKIRTLIKVFLIAAISLILLFAAVWFFASYQLSRLDSFRGSITTALGKALDRNVTYEKGKATLTLRNGLALQFTNLVIREKDQSADLLTAHAAFFRVDIVPLLVKRVILREVILDQPRLSLKRDQAGALNIADLLSPQKKQGMNLALRKVTIDKGLLVFTDQKTGTDGRITALKNLHCQIDPPRSGNTFNFSITATLIENKNQGELALAGTFQLAPSEKPIREGTLNASLRLTGIDINHYLPYLHDHVPFEQLAGRLDMETTVAGTFSQFTAKGTISVKDVLLNYPQVFGEPLRPKTVHVDYVLTRNADKLNLDVTRLAVDRFAATGRFAIQDMDKEDPLLAATATTSTCSHTEMQPYIPWGIIPQNIGGFIKTHIQGGNFRLVEGKLNGRLSQIADILKQENAGVLSIQVEIDNGVFVVGGNTTPDFRDVSGMIELNNRQFSLRNMTCRFGTSPCKLEGSISDFALPPPVVYKASMTIAPSRDEVLWVLGKEKFSKLAFDGSSTLQLSGSGPADDFHASARWDLTQVSYAYPDVIEKARDKPNQLSAEIILNEDAFRVSSLIYDLSPVTINGSATYRFAGKKDLSLSVLSNTFDIAKAVSFLPALRKFNPAGSCLIDIAGHGDSRKLDSFVWKGKVSFTKVAFKPSVAVKPVSNLTGVATFQGTKMETSLIKAHVGESAIRGKCRIQNFRKANLACQFIAPVIRATDVGLYSKDGDMNFHDVKGKITISNSRLHVDQLSIRFGKSIFNLSGDVSNIVYPKIVATLNSPFISSDDFARLMTLKYQKKDDHSPSMLQLQLTLRVDAGVFNGIDFGKLDAGLKFTKSIMNIEILNAVVLDGNLKGKGTVEIRPDGQNLYKANLSLDRMSLDRLQVLWDVEKHAITGNLSLAGDVTAKGSTVDDLKKTATGTFQLTAEKGVLKKFSVFSKIFSLLNVFQLLRLRLPDMAKDGMPYSKVTADLSLKEGVLSSEDFLIESNAMGISAVGKVYLFQKELDSIVGVHPLQTLDKITAKIPIIGWILTDENGHLLTVHFKVEGNWDDPQVTAIPVRSIAKGTLDIFRRIFQLPEKLITDTGEVILGN